MGSVVTKYGECTGTTILLFIALILGIIGIALIYTIIGILIGFGFIIAACIVFIIAAIMLGKMLYKEGFSNQGLWCKMNILLAMVVFIVILVEIIVGCIEHNKQSQPANPLPANT